MSGKVTILIADDNPNDRMAPRDFLEAKGYDVFEAEDTEDTFKQALEKAPDLLVLDVEMPPEDGYAVCRRLRNDPRTRSIPILMLTCHGFNEEMVNGLHAGADDYVVKPCDSEVLLARIEALFRRYPPKVRFIECLEHAQDSIEAVESHRRYIVVLNIDVQGSSRPLTLHNEEYLRHLIFEDYHTLVEKAVSAHGGMGVAWSGDGGTAEFSDVASAVLTATEILQRRAKHPRVSNLVLRIGIAAGSELIAPDSVIGKRTSQTHNRAGHFQKYANPNTITAGEEIVVALPDPSWFCLRSNINGEVVFETRISTPFGE